MQLRIWQRLGVRLASLFALVTLLAVVLVGLVIHERQRRELEDAVGTQLLNIARIGSLLVDPAAHTRAQAAPRRGDPDYVRVRETLARIRPGETTYEDVLKLTGGEPEEEQRSPAGEILSVIYRGQSMVPNRGRRFGWFATVNHWEVEQREVQIDFERERVHDIHARIRRARLTQPPAA